MLKDCTKAQMPAEKAQLPACADFRSASAGSANAKAQTPAHRVPMSSDQFLAPDCN